MEKEKSVWKEEIKAYEAKLKLKLSAKSSDINVPHYVIQEGKLLSLIDEDDDFISSFNRVIDSEDIKHIDDLRVGEDHFVGMEVGIKKGNGAKLDKRIVKK